MSIMLKRDDLEIPFHRTEITGDDEQLVLAALRSGGLDAGGPFSECVSKELCEATGAAEVFLTTSGSAALEMAALCLEVSPGDEVVVPSFTFPSTANAFLLRGAKVVLADVAPNTLCLDIEKVRSLLTPHTRIVVPVHYGGTSCDMVKLCQLATEWGFVIVEDNANGLFGKYKGRVLGNFGMMSASSFHQTKSFVCGEGGALMVNDPGLVEGAEVLFEKGTNRRQFLRGEVLRYDWRAVGSSFGMSEVLAAMLWGQLKRREDLCSKRRKLWCSYRQRLKSWAGDRGYLLAEIPPESDPAHDSFWLMVRDGEERGRLIAHLRRFRIEASSHYVALHLSPMGRKLGYGLGDFPVSEVATETLVRLPFYSSMTEDEQDRVVHQLISFQK